MKINFDIMNNDNVILTHHWLKPLNQPVYHAYSKMLLVRPMCKLGPIISELNEIDLPGDESPLCVDCFSILYKLNLTSESQKDKK